jgi:transcriptional regulator with XRE-family HTH domain
MIVRRRAPQSAAGVALRHRFALNVRHFRKKRGMTQRELADAAGVGRTFVSQVERGRFSVTLETMGAISSALGISPTLLIQSGE